MTKVGITGHQNIPMGKPQDDIIQGIKDCLSDLPTPIVGYTSLAIGADQLFAQAVLDVGGQLMAIIPCPGYEETFRPENLPAFQDLLAQTVEHEVLDYPMYDPTDPKGSEPAFMAAGEEIIKRSDILIAVWDGQPALGLGGTADAVAYAKSLGKPVVVIWPEGVVR